MEAEVWPMGDNGDEWGITGHLDDAAALAAVQRWERIGGYDPPDAVNVDRTWMRDIPCPIGSLGCCSDCSGTHFELCNRAAAGAYPVTWVYRASEYTEDDD